MEVDRFSVDVVIPTVRANIRSLRRAVESQCHPPLMASNLLLSSTVPSPSMLGVNRLLPTGSAVSLHSTRPNHRMAGWRLCRAERGH